MTDASVSGSAVGATHLVGAVCDAEMPFTVRRRAAVPKAEFPRFVLECGVDRAPIVTLEVEPRESRAGGCVKCVSCP